MFSTAVAWVVRRQIRKSKAVGGKRMNVKRLDGESDSELIYRVCLMKQAIGSWVDVANILNSELGVN